MPLYKKKSTNSGSNGIEIPTRIKTAANDADYALMIDSEGLYKIAKPDLFAGLSSGGEGEVKTPPTTTNITLAFSSNGDDNGLLYYLGSDGKTTAWSNPNGNTVLVSAMSTEFGSPELLIDRSANEWYSANTPNSYVELKIITGGKLKCNKYSFKTRSRIDYYPRNWQFLGKNNNNTWDILDEQINNNSLISASRWLTLPCLDTTAYSSFRLLQNGLDSSGYDYFCLGEIELYGIYIP